MTFLGYQFKPRRSKNKAGELFTGYGAGISKKSRHRINAELRDMQIDRRTGRTIEQLSQLLNSKVRGWLNYYSRYNRWEMQYIMYRINQLLVKWVRRKYKVIGKYRAKAMMQLKQQRYPKLFAHWQVGFNV